MGKLRTILNSEITYMSLWPEIVATDGSMGSCSLLSGFIPVHIFRVICIKFVLFSFQFLGTLTSDYRTLIRAKLREVTNSSDRLRIV